MLPQSEGWEEPGSIDPGSLRFRPELLFENVSLKLLNRLNSGFLFSRFRLYLTAVSLKRWFPFPDLVSSPGAVAWRLRSLERLYSMAAIEPISTVCEVCGDPVSVFVRDTASRPGPGGSTLFRPAGPVHSYCENHDRNSVNFRTGISAERCPGLLDEVHPLVGLQTGRGC